VPRNHLFFALTVRCYVQELLALCCCRFTFCAIRFSGQGARLGFVVDMDGMIASRSPTFSFAEMEAVLLAS